MKRNLTKFDKTRKKNSFYLQNNKKASCDKSIKAWKMADVSKQVEISMRPTQTDISRILWMNDASIYLENLLLHLLFIQG